MNSDNPPARRGRSAGDPEPGRPQGWLEAITAMATVFGILLQQGYPALYALLVVLALVVGATIVVRQLQRGPDDSDDGPGAPRWAQ
ncbi:hypothetical protein [Actinomadura mexicana]|uniref:Uncharacterized protein n=1 Tax=Actinomadura mexicana TaxID=134959 RepID=A0A239HGA9_9ACTN|nr:hypothetical protein [Actinomadura mexicana]SNS80171.1 hypothetical protein SAMN06265355_1315 [Actinomadura mexicana]